MKALFPENSSRLTTIIVENHEIPTAYDEAVQGVEIVIHMASPLVPPHAFDNEKDILIPARDGAVNILKSASKSPSVKRVVFTSSSTAVTNNDIPRSESYRLEIAIHANGELELFGQRATGIRKLGKMESRDKEVSRTPFRRPLRSTRHGILWTRISLILTSSH